MAKYEVEFAKFVKVKIEAESREEAHDKAAVMETEKIEEGSVETSGDGYVIWNVTRIKDHD